MLIMAANGVALARKRKLDAFHHQHHDRVFEPKLSTRKYSTGRDFPCGRWNPTHRLVPKISKSANGKSSAEFQVSDKFRNRNSRLLKMTSSSGFRKYSERDSNNPRGVTFASSIFESSTLWSARVDETINLFRQLLSQIRLKNRLIGLKNSVTDHMSAAKLLKQQGKWLNTEKRLGAIQGVAIGDRFQSRAEMTVIGLHLQLRRGIDYVKVNGRKLATSIVDSRRYSKTEITKLSPDVLIYSGEGGNPNAQTLAKPEDQKLQRGNEALENSMMMKKPIRFVRKVRIPGQPLSSYEFVYEGWYMVVDYNYVRGEQGKYVYEFVLRRMVQPFKPKSSTPTRPRKQWKYGRYE
ncbi:SRA-YDG domain-containing protein [Corchorus capsularis]|uniref:SRA-YDG domain-containing protein n=1 Tax=Corchorus capsularis TaxID=210143 RepID=A0A1R3JL31_COCAP|nr:SRA-YDG domain-containing protein [Corchorus capsularis]